MEPSLKKCGEVHLKDFDVGMMAKMITDAVDYSEPNIGQYRKLFRKVSGVADFERDPNVPNTVREDLVPVIFMWPEEAYQNFVYPSIVIQRSDLVPAARRWNYQSTEYQVPAEGAQVVAQTSTKVVHNRYEKRGIAIPYDISYTMNVYSKWRNQFELIRRDVLALFPMYGIILVNDSENEQRLYDTFLERVAQNDEYPEVTQRGLVASIDVRVEAELDEGSVDMNERYVVHTVVERVLQVRNLLARE